MHQPIIRPLAAVLCAAAIAACGTDSGGNGQDPQDTHSNQWLRDADSDALRFERLEYYLAGFSSSMWEVGERYRRLHEALRAGNHDLARYHWDKIRGAIERGTMKRPGRRANAEALFLDSIWQEVDEAFADGGRETAREALARARNACMACHVAEDVPYMNEQPLFTELLP